MNLATQEISHPAVADSLDRRNPHPVSIHSVDRAEVEAFVARESKRRNRTVSTSVEYFRLPSGKVFRRYVAVSHPVVNEAKPVLRRADRAYYSGEDFKHAENKRASQPKCDGACCN